MAIARSHAESPRPVRVFTRDSGLLPSDSPNRQRDRRPGLSFAGRLVLGLFVLALPAGCVSPSSSSLTPPNRVVAPYPAVLAVAPLSNESGVTIDPASRAEVSDDLVAAINGVEGWDAVPLDRTLTAMAQLGLAEIRSEADARRLMETIGVDGMLVGTITQWGPYDPPRFGANVLLIGDRGRLQASLDPRALSGRTGDADSTGGTAEPVATVTDLVVDLDAVNHGTRARLRAYAESHHDVSGGFDPPERYYLMVFDRFLEFAAQEVIGGLVDRERGRLLAGG